MRNKLPKKSGQNFNQKTGGAKREKNGSDQLTVPFVLLLLGWRKTGGRFINKAQWEKYQAVGKVTC